MEKRRRESDDIDIHYLSQRIESLERYFEKIDGTLEQIREAISQNNTATQLLQAENDRVRERVSQNEQELKNLKTEIHNIRNNQAGIIAKVGFIMALVVSGAIAAIKFLFQK